MLREIHVLLRSVSVQDPNLNATVRDSPVSSQPLVMFDGGHEITKDRHRGPAVDFVDRYETGGVTLECMFRGFYKGATGSDKLRSTCANAGGDPAHEVSVLRALVKGCRKHISLRPIRTRKPILHVRYVDTDRERV